MTQREQYEKKTEELLMPILTAHQFELVDVEYVKEVGNWYLRAYIDKPEGINVNDCEVVSRELEVLLDQADFIADPYILEVSSPGLTRPLKKEKDYERNRNRLIEIRLFKAIDRKKEFTGTLADFDKDTITLQTETDTYVIERSNLAMIRQAFVM